MALGGKKKSVNKIKLSFNSTHDIWYDIFYGHDEQATYTLQ